MAEIVHAYPQNKKKQKKGVKGGGTVELKDLEPKPES